MAYTPHNHINVCERVRAIERGWGSAKREERFARKKEINWINVTSSIVMSIKISPKIYLVLVTFKYLPYSAQNTFEVRRYNLNRDALEPKRKQKKQLNQNVLLNYVRLLTDLSNTQNPHSHIHLHKYIHSPKKK